MNAVAYDRRIGGRSEEEFGERLRAARERAGLTQRALSFSGCSPGYIAMLEQGKRRPSSRVVDELARRLGVARDYLLTGSTDAATALLEEAEFALRLDEVERAAELLERAGDAVETPEQRARLAAARGLLARRRGDPRSAVSLLEEAFALGCPWTSLDPVDALARSYAETGDLVRAVATLERGRQAMAVDGPTLNRIRMSVILSAALVDQAEFARAAEVLGEVLPEIEKLNDPRTRARFYWAESRLHVARGNADLARAAADKAVALIEEHEDVFTIGQGYQLLAFIAIERGEPAHALDLLRRPAAREAAERNDHLRAIFALEEARALAMLAEDEAALALAETAAAVLDEIDPLEAGRAHALRGRLLAKRGETADAIAEYERAVSVLPEPYLLRAASEFAELLRELGRPEQALDVLQQALERRVRTNSSA